MDNYNEYCTAGGVAMTFGERKSQLISILPMELREKLVDQLQDGKLNSTPRMTDWIRIRQEFRDRWSDNTSKGERCQVVDSMMTKAHSKSPVTRGSAPHLGL